MNKLTKAQIDRHNQIAAELRTKLDEIDRVQEECNAKIREINEALDVAYGDFNAVVEEANGFMQEIASDMQNYYDEKSEKWQEGDRGQTYQEKIQDFENELEEATFDPIEELTLPEPSPGVEEFENLPTDFTE